MRSVILAAATIAAADAIAVDQKLVEAKAQFASWSSEHGKDYQSPEAHKTAFLNFVANDEIIQSTNALGLSYKLGHNQFSDLSLAEWKRVYVTGYRATNRTKSYDYSLKNFKVGDDVDWVAKGAVTPIKDQGQCGSCWAFSTTGSVEGAYQIATGSLVSFSEQDLVSCDTEKDQGCNGGLMDYAFEFIKANGLCTEADYPYTAGGGTSGTCVKGCKPGVFVTGYTDVPEKDENALLAGLAQGPVSVAVEADTSAWQFYSSGVLDDASCGQNLDHGVLAVGFGTDGKDYFKVKNSWGTGWGEAGYIRLVRGKNQCGVALAASYPKVDTPRPTPPTPPTPGPPPTAADDPCAKLMAAYCTEERQQGVDACMRCCESYEDIFGDACTTEKETNWCNGH